MTPVTDARDLLRDDHTAGEFCLLLELHGIAYTIETKHDKHLLPIKVLLIEDQEVAVFDQTGSLCDFS